MGINRNSLPPHAKRIVDLAYAAATGDSTRLRRKGIEGVRLPYPPSVNHYWGSNGKRRYILPAGVEFRDRVFNILAGCKQLRGNVALKIEVYPPDKRRRDLDNVLKAILDALQHADAMKDDNQVAALHVWRRDTRPPDGAVVVTLTRVEVKE